MAKAILFDIDGTLIDSNDLHTAAWQEAFRHFGVDLPFNEIRSQIGKGGDNLIPALLPPELAKEKQQEIEDFRSELFQHEYLPRVVPFPGVRALFERLAADGVKIVLASSAKRAELEHHKGLLGIEDLVTGGTSKDDVESSKPCPDIFEAAMRKVAPITVRDAVVVGDSPWDVKAACKAGLRTIGVLSGGFSEEELREAGAVEIHEGPEDLLRNYESSLLSPDK
ncbi:MAG TPA: HAD family hydrolase [Allosphingosinicella sp.]|uniref:HAD family hydrolase n=1 Tax=Allosphingosinicella sp. TaxID=2823234 RepID=UPI002ED84C6A